MILSIDLGGTKLQYGVFDSQAEMQQGDTVPTRADFLSQLKAIIGDVVNTCDIRAIAIGVPGPTSGNVMYGSFPLGVTDNVDFNEVLGEFGVPVIARNDLDMAIHCELHQGVGRTHRNFCLLSLSTGIGVSVVIDGVVLDRKVEMGHQVLRPDLDPPAPCMGHSNCWAALASGSGIASRYGNDEYKTTEAIFEHVLTDADIRELRAINAHAFGNIVSAYDPEVIVVMGSLGLVHFDRIVPRGDEIAAYTINRPIPQVTRCSFQDNIGILGACLAAMSGMAAGSPG